MSPKSLTRAEKLAAAIAKGLPLEGFDPLPGGSRNKRAVKPFARSLAAKPVYRKAHSEDGFVRGASLARCSKAKKGHLAGTSIGRQHQLNLDSLEQFYPKGKMVHFFEADNVSGKFGKNNPSLQAMLAAAERREFDILFTEEADRVLRNGAEMAKIFQQFQAWGIKIHTYMHGPVDPFMGTLRAFLGEEERSKMSARVTSSRRIYIQSGRVMGLVPYGFYPDQDDRAAVNKDEAEIVDYVHRLFGELRLGTMHICDILEGQGIPTPSGKGRWHPATLLGHRYNNNGKPLRLGGILGRSDYEGIRISSQITTQFDADGNGQTVLQPEEKWIRTNVPRIIDERLAALVRARLDELDVQYFNGDVVYHHNDYLFKGMLSCMTCEGPLIISGGGTKNTPSPFEAATRARCRNAVHGQCGNGRTYDLANIQAGIVRVMADWTSTPRLRKYYEAQFERECAKIEAANSSEEPAKLQAEIDSITSEMTALARNARVTPEDVYASTMTGHEKKRDELQEKLRLLAAPPPTRDFASVSAGVASITLLTNELPKSMRQIDDLAVLTAIAKFKGLFKKILIGGFDAYNTFAFDIHTVIGRRSGKMLSKFVRLKDGQQTILSHLQDAAPHGATLDDLKVCLADTGSDRKNYALNSCNSLLRDGLIELRADAHYYATLREPFVPGSATSIVAIYYDEESLKD